ncbi:hypothetical protein BBD42_21905 [Paenibacillus sp. BIHB 4019]|uniref:Uncharacterized protein n=1 Tax=Paenibacillus sp. BIHB 4019 TaxID=1870819 RepID=A0A1B2DM86_9BACL|nr:hypothetical protein BBD42_21905 [Paenibacillus sp. BIHB 4019]KQO17434.1 hypothetical protein ASF12_01730 [Paenibacillus sp. Leaf72]
MSRVQKFGKATRKGPSPEKTEAPRIDEEGREILPPRRKKFPSGASKVTRWYYNVLFFLFLSLVAGLFWYGLKYAN